MVDWSGAILAILRAVKKDKSRIDPKFIAIKPRKLSDDNILRGVAALRAVLAFVPHTALAVPVLSLGEMGFNLWKRISLMREYDQIKFPPLDPNVLRFQIQTEGELNKHYGILADEHNWNSETISELEEIFNDFSYITSFELMKAKYPHIDEDYIKESCARNKEILQANLHEIEQQITKVSHRPEVKSDMINAVETLKHLFPAMRDWALLSSEGFQEMVEIIDLVI